MVRESPLSHRERVMVREFPLSHRERVRVRVPWPVSLLHMRRLFATLRMRQVHVDCSGVTKGSLKGGC